MLNKLFSFFLLVLFCVGCDNAGKPKIGVSFGTGHSKRWPVEIEAMKKRAEELGITIEIRHNQTDTPKTQAEDCIEMIDSGIKALILVPRDIHKNDEILAYAKEKNVKVISYARTVMGENIDLFIGYDVYKIGQNLGLHLTEKVYRGNIAILKGDPNDINAIYLYDGALKHIRPLAAQGNLNIIMDEYINRWSPELAKEKLKEAIKRNHYKIDGVFAENDRLAGAAADAVRELGIRNHVVIVGMDADINATRRLVRGTQDATVYMNLKDMAHTAVNEAYNMATNKKKNANSTYDNESDFKIDAYLINGKIITRENLDKLIIEPGIFTREEVYGN